MVAEETLVLYSAIDKCVIAEIYAGDNYYLPTNENTTEVYIGTLEDFLAENPDYEE